MDNLILNAGRIKPKRFCSLVYEKRDVLKLNKQLIKLDSDINLNLKDNISPDINNLEKILIELEMKKSLEEANNRYVK